MYSESLLQNNHSAGLANRVINLMNMLSKLSPRINMEAPSANKIDKQCFDKLDESFIHICNNVNQIPNNISPRDTMCYVLGSATDLKPS